MYAVEGKIKRVIQIQILTESFRSSFYEDWEVWESAKLWEVMQLVIFYNANKSSEYSGSFYQTELVYKIMPLSGPEAIFHYQNVTVQLEQK